MTATVFYWTCSAVAGFFSAWCIVATVIEVARQRSKPLSFDVILGVILHGGTAVLALWLANLAGRSG